MYAKWWLHWRTLKTQKKMNIIIFLTQNILSIIQQVKSAGNDTPPLSIPKTGVFIDNDHHQLRICDLLFFLLVASPRINEAKYLIIPHIACRYTCIKSSFSLIYSCIIPATFVWTWTTWRNWNVKTRVRVSVVTWYYNSIPSTVQRLRDRYQATGTVKY